MADVGATVGRPHQAWPADGNCANCGTMLLGDWCHGCGQRAADHHRSLRHLGVEAIEGLTHADGRLWRTLGLLAVRPGKLTRDYLAGKRASEIPPLRLFLVALLLVFAVGAVSGPHIDTLRPSGADAEDARRTIVGLGIDGWPQLTAWLRAHLLRVLDQPDALLDAMREWSERVAVLLLPLSALALRLVFLLRRGVGLYDHAVFAMHSLSFSVLALTLVMVISRFGALHRAALLLLLVALPVHLFVHMRGVYRTSAVGTLARMAGLAILTMGVFVLLVVILAAVSLSTLSA